MTNKSARLNNRRFFQDRNSDLTVFCFLIVLICSAVLVLTGCDNKGDQPEVSNIVKPEKAEFVDRQSCIDCHEKQYAEWTDSHHDLAMDVATGETVLGDFNNSTFNNYGLTTTFSIKLTSVFLALQN